LIGAHLWRQSFPNVGVTFRQTTLSGSFVKNEREQWDFASLRSAVNVNFFSGDTVCGIVHDGVTDFDPSTHNDLLGFTS
jgi:hypothetical protein